jgi:hypothetical protein
MSKEKPTPAPTRTPGEALERMKELTRRLIRVPKAAIVKPKKMLRKHR